MAANIKIFAAFLLALCFAPMAWAQNVGIVSTQDISTTSYGTKLSSVACNAAAASRWTGWINVSTKSSVVFDLDIVDADASGAVSFRCETSRVNTTVADAGRDMPVITATATTGISNLTQASYSILSTAGGNPGTSSWVLKIDSIPAPWIECLFSCGASGADNVTVFARGITP